MRQFKMSKTAWIIIAVSVFLVVAISIVVLYRDRADQENELKTELLDLQQQLSVFQPEKLANQLEQLETRLAGSEAEIKAQQNRLKGSTNVIDRAEELYALAESHGVEVNDISSGALTSNILGEVSFTSLSLNAEIGGSVPRIISFISDLSSAISTCVVQSVDLDVPSASDQHEPTATMLLTIYSYTGE